ncbi:uncharacterized protein N7511_011281 [Penicillium nucicola]|uniref:uncharacterized protein n=1 Tax=Penicillium nucicola TaxID=1850975 RepID=UPI0025455806|nr:uncharacterized protein N7511_011281 [Penicillium nucicola]KAJ5742549.1 hypothetical protein N7511_011281 [Penicillium nucicola]
MNPSTQSLDVTLEALSALSLRGERNQLETLIHDFFSQTYKAAAEARHIWEREGWNGEGLSNYITLLCGILNFPAILLLNPSGWDYLPWNEMIENSPTLTWLEQALEPWGFTLRDIIIIDTFPLLTDRDMNSMEDAEKLRLSSEVFNLTVSFLHRFKPPVMVSCQCATKTSHPRWGIVEHPVAALLCSSVGGARRREVAQLSVNERIIHVVQGFHPMYIERTADPEIRSGLDETLHSIIEKLYRPCAEWKDQRDRECQENLLVAAREVDATMAAFLDSLTAYRRCQRQAVGFETISAERGTHYKFSDWVQFKAKVRSFVSTLLPASL